MRSVLLSITSLLLGVSLLLLGSGLQGTLLGIRGAIEAFSPIFIGLIMTAYYVGFAAGCYWGARVIERVGHVRAFSAFASLASAATIVFPVFVEPYAWLVLRVLAGACFAILYMAIESWLNGRIPNENRGRLLAVYMIVNLGSIAGAQQLLKLADPGGFILFALSSVLVSLALVPVSLSTSQAPSPVRTDRMSLAELYTNSPLAVVGAFSIGLANGAMWGLIPLAGIQTGYTTADIATFMTVVVLGGVALQWPVGRLSDMLDRRHVIIMAGMVMCAVSGALYFLVSGDKAVALLLAFLLGGMNLVIYPLCAAHINDRITQEDVIQANGALLLVLGVGAAAGPLAGGLVMDAFGPLSLYLYMASVAVAFVLFAVYRLSKREPSPASEQMAFEPVSPAPVTPVMDPRIDPEDIELA